MSVGQNVSYLNKTRHANYVYTEGHRPIPQDRNAIYLIELTMIMNKRYHWQLHAVLVEGTFLEIFKTGQVGVQKISSYYNSGVFTVRLITLGLLMRFVEVLLA